MPTDHRCVRIFLARLFQDYSLDELREHLKPKHHNENFTGTVKLPEGLAEYATQDQVRALAHARATQAGDRGQP